MTCIKSICKHQIGRQLKAWFYGCSCNHRKFWASVLILKEPVAHIDCKVDLLTLDDFKLIFVLLHENRDKLVTNLWSVLSRVVGTEFLLFKLCKLFRLDFAVAFPALFPANFVETLSEEDDESEYCPIKLVTHFLTHSVQIEGKYLINFHVHFVVIAQV